MTCPNCQTAGDSGDKFCRQCGGRMTSVNPAVTSDAADADPRLEPLFQEAFDRLQRGELELAFGAVQQILSICPESLTAHSTLGMIYERQGRIEQAIEEYRAVVRENPDSVADREKLEGLLGLPAPELRRARQRTRNVLIGGVAAVAVIAAAGIFLGSQTEQPDRRSGGAGGGKLMPATAGPSGGVSLPNPPVDSKPLPVQPLATAPEPAVSPSLRTQISASVPTVSIPLGPARQGSSARPNPVTSGSAIIGEQRVGLPAVVNRPRTEMQAGMPPATIREIIPLGPPHGAAGMGGPQQLQPVGQPYPGPDTASTERRETSSPRVEPLETETGFIKIETGPAAPAGSGREKPQEASSGRGGSTPPSISIKIGPATPERNAPKP